MRGTTRPLLPVLAFVCGVLACAGVASAAAAASSTVKAVRVWSGPDTTQVIFELTGPVEYQLFQLGHPDRVVVDLDNGAFGKGVGAKSGKGAVRDIRVGHFDGKARFVLDLDKPAHPRSFLLNPTAQYGYRLVVDLGTPGTHSSQIVRTVDADIAHGTPRPVVVAVDPGHGGDDSGAIGPNGTMEKTVTLEIARDLQRLIDAQPGMHAVMTRKGDYYVPLKKRFEIAREDKADLFVSIHANSCPNFCDARGGSVWVLDTHGKQSEAARWLARSENASDLIGGVSLDNKNPTLASVLLDLSQGASMHAAHEVGGDVLAALGKIEPLYRSTVQGANFVVLRSPDVPSILVETTFISNRHGERRLDSRTDREQLAQAIFAGVKQYFETTPPPGTWFAEQRNQRMHLAVAQVASNGRTIATAQAAARAPVVVAAAKKSAQADDAIQDMHRVTAGETLSGIAQQYGVSMSALRSLNPNKVQAGGGIQAGQVLLIPNS